MKVLHVMAGAESGGAETACIDMCLAQAAAGAHIEIATRRNARNAVLRDAGIVVHELPFGGRLDFTTTRGLQKIIAVFQPQIVQTWMSRAAQKMPRRQAGATYRVVARLGGYYKLRYFSRADYFIPITNAITQYLEGEGITPHHIRHINNFADTEAATQAVSRALFETPDDAPLLLALGRLHRAKAFDILLQALAALPNIYLWIAGEGPERQTLEQQARTLNIQDRVRFLGWRDDRANLFAAANICVFPSRYEPFGTVFVQAWAHGVPLVATAADGPREFVRDGEDGLLVPIDDAPALAAAVRRILADDALATNLTTHGYARYQNEFTKAKTVQAYLNFYRYIADGTAIGSAP